MRTERITAAEIKEVAEKNGAQYAHDLLLLGGPEWYAESYTEYCDLLEGFEAEVAYSTERV